MSKTTAEELVEACFRDLIPSIPTIFDYFGNAETETDLSIVLGIYQGLLKYKSVDVDYLYQCFLQDKLNELVHAKFKFKPTGYYKMFCDRKLDLQSKTIFAKNELQDKFIELNIYDDDHCPICNKRGVITKDYGIPMDCVKCLKFMCKKCCGTYDEDSNITCKYCLKK